MQKGTHMAEILDSILRKDVAEAKAALARHGIVIIRQLETDLEPAIIAEAKNSIVSSPEVLSGMSDEELDKLMEGLRKVAMRSTKELVTLHTRLLAQLGTEGLGDLVKELDGIGRLFTWERVSKTVDPVNRRLTKAGFDAIRLSGAETVSDAFALELNERWPAAFSRFSILAKEAAKELKPPPRKATPSRKTAPRKRTKSAKKR
jgi:hypothetical protein